MWQFRSIHISLVFEDEGLLSDALAIYCGPLSHAYRQPKISCKLLSIYFCDNLWMNHSVLLRTDNSITCSASGMEHTLHSEAMEYFVILNSNSLWAKALYDPGRRFLTKEISLSIPWKRLSILGRGYQDTWQRGEKQLIIG